jgi:hypothetical protein
MPCYQHRQLQDHSPLLYSSLMTRRSSYLTWVLVVSSPFPHVIGRTDLGNEVAQLLLSSNRGFEVHCVTFLLHCFYPDTVWEHAEIAIMAYLPDKINSFYIIYNIIITYS